MPDSALPAPTSTVSVTPCAAIQATLSRQRTRPVTCSTSSRRISSGSLTASARDVGHQRHRRAPRSPRPPAPRPSRRPPAASARSGTARSPAAASPAWRRCALAISTARSTAAVAPETTTCAGSLSFAACADLALRRLRRHRLDRGEVEPEQRRHRPLADRHRLLHRLRRAAAAAARCRRGRARRRRRAPNTRRANARRRRPPADPERPRPPAPAAPRARSPSAPAGRCAVSVSSAMSPSQISADSFSPSAVVDLVEHRRAPPDRPRRGRGPCRSPGRPAPETRMPAPKLPRSRAALCGPSVPH